MVDFNGFASTYVCHARYQNDTLLHLFTDHGPSEAWRLHELKQSDTETAQKILLEARPCLIGRIDHDLDTPGSRTKTTESGQDFWTRKGLIEVLGDQQVSIAVTPNG